MTRARFSRSSVGRQTQRPRLRRGITLIELMVTVAVIAIIAAIAAPSLSGFIERQRLRSATELVLNAVQSARADAASLSRRLYLGIQSGNAGAWAVGYGDTDDCGKANNVNATVCTVNTLVGSTPQNVVKVWSGSGEHGTVSLSSSGNVMQAVIDPVRGVVAPALTLQLTSPSGLETRVLLSTLGRASACSPAGASNVAGLSTCP